MSDHKQTTFCALCSIPTRSDVTLKCSRLAQQISPDNNISIRNSNAIRLGFKSNQSGDGFEASWRRRYNLHDLCKFNQSLKDMDTAFAD